MPTPRQHALLSASSAHRWLACTAAPHFEESFPDGTSSYAEEGTLAHAICELYARKKFTVLSTRKFNSELKKLQARPLYSDEMLRTAEAYVDYLTEKAMQYATSPHVAMEVKVDLTAYIPDGFGTCDCIMIGGDTLHITDYKHGKGVPVSAENNPQMRLYALGALRLYGPIYGDQIKRVSMGICQPRLSQEASEDALGTRPFVDRNNIGVIGICGSGSFSISAAKIDPRLKAIATISMYNMGTASRNGLKHALTLEQRKQIMAEAAEQRYAEFLGGETKYIGGTVHEVTENSGPIEREFYEFYRTQRGEFTPEGATPMTTTHPTLSSNVKFMNFYPFADIETISPRPMLFITGENAHSREFSEDAYRLAAEPKELYIVPGAGHVDLYDRVGFIPFDKLESFFKEYLKK